MSRLLLVAAAALLAGGALFMATRAGNDSGSAPTGSALETPAADGERDSTRNPSGSGGTDDSGGSASGDPAAGGSDPVLPESSCPPELSNCVVASGRVIYVEAVDPDGDGDAHFITDSEEGVTIPGMTVFDVRTDLRPDPLPEVGDLVGGAGPVFPGSYGQKQIEVIEFHVAR